MFELYQSFLNETFQQFFLPQKRLFYGYLILAVLISFIWAILKKFPFKRLIFLLFSKKVLWSDSAKADYKLFIINRIIFFLINPLLISQLFIASIIYEFLHFQNYLSLGIFSNLSQGFVVLLFTVTFFLFDDFSKFWIHRMMHKIPLLWNFHKVHHSATTLNPMTIFRTHPIEGLLFALRVSIVQGTCISTFIFLFGDKVDLLTIFGVNIFVLVFHATGSNLRHSHIRIRYWKWMEYLLISPAQHHIHHSTYKKHFNKNYGVALAIWDWIYGTLHLSENRVCKFGLLNDNMSNKHSLYSLYFEPFQNFYIQFQKYLKELIMKKDIFKIHKFKIVSIAIFLGFLSSIILYKPLSANEINIYSHRQPFLIEPFLDKFTEKTGIKTNVVYSSKGLAQRMAIEGKNSPADVVLTVDIARLSVYADKNLLSEINSDILTKRIPKHLRSPQNNWFAFSKRTRVIAVSKKRLTKSSITRFEELSDPKWKGKICSRPGSHVYNRSLLASIIAAVGEEDASKWAKGLVKNLARRPQGNDRAQVKAIYSGQCDIAIINHYYFGKLLYSDNPEHKKWANSISLIFPNQANGDRGAHINISGGGIAKYSKNKNNAVKFLEFLVSQEAQELYAKINFEYPIDESIELPNILKTWGKFKEDKLPIIKISELSPTAQKIIDSSGW